MPGIVDPITYFGVSAEYLNDDEPITPEMRSATLRAVAALYSRGGPVRIIELLSGGVTKIRRSGRRGCRRRTRRCREDRCRSYQAAVLKNPQGWTSRSASDPPRFRSRQREPSTRAAVLDLLRTA